VKVVLDTNCLLDAVNESATAYRALQKLLAEARAGRIELCVSRHTLSELSKDDPKTRRAKAIANGCVTLPHYTIGSWDKQVATWEQSAGSWDDARRNQDLQLELASLANAGNDIRDRGAYIDALLARAAVFVTSDRQLVGSGPASRIRQRFDLRVVTPDALAAELNT
jgi:predicted nucleic acid-binding protein